MSSGDVDEQDIVCAESLAALGSDGRSDDDHSEAAKDNGTVIAEAAARSTASATSLHDETGRCNVDDVRASTDNVDKQREGQEAPTDGIVPPSEEATSASHHSETAPKISKSTKQVIHNLIVANDDLVWSIKDGEEIEDYAGYSAYLL